MEEWELEGAGWEGWVWEVSWRQDGDGEQPKRYLDGKDWVLGRNQGSPQVLTMITRGKIPSNSGEGARSGHLLQSNW